MKRRRCYIVYESDIAQWDILEGILDEIAASRSSRKCDKRMWGTLIPKLKTGFDTEGSDYEASKLLQVVCPNPCEPWRLLTKCVWQV